MRGILNNRTLRRGIAAAAMLLMLASPGSATAALTIPGAVPKSPDVAVQLARDCARNPDALHLYQIGASARFRKPIWLTRVTALTPDAAPGSASSVRLLVICRQHGDEPVSTQAALEWLGECAAMNRDELRQKLGGVTVYIIPEANPDGADNLDRFTGTGGDMNRDWGVFALPETRAVAAAERKIKPNVLIDMHSWDMTDPFQANSVEAGGGDGAGPTASPAALQRAIIASIRSETEQQVSSLSYSPEADGRLCHRYYAAQGIPAALVETSAGPYDSRAAMAGRVEYDLAALRGAIAYTGGGQPIAGSVPQSSFGASADALAGRSAPSPAAGSRSKYLPAQLGAVRRRAIWVALALYLAACAVLAAASGQSPAAAWRRLLTRHGPARREAYVSIRASHYPARAREKTSTLLAASAASRNAPVRCR